MPISYNIQLSYKLQVTGFKLQVTNYELQITSYKLRVISMKNTYCLFQIKFITEYPNVQHIIITQILLKQFN